MVIRKLIPVPLSEDGSPRKRRQNLLAHVPRLDLLPRFLLQLLGVDVGDLPLLARREALRQLDQLVLRDVDILHPDGAIGRLPRMRQDSPHGLAGRRQARGGDQLVAPIVDFRLPLLEVEEQAAPQPQIQERAREHQRVARVSLDRELVKVLPDLDLGRVDGEWVRVGVLGVAAEFGWDDALDARGDGGVDEEALGGDGVGGEGGDEGVLVAEGGGEGREGGVVYFLDLDVGGKGVGAGRAGKDGDFEEAGFDELF